MVWGPQVAVLGVVVVHDGHGGDVFAVDKLGIIITIVRHFSIIVANSSSPKKYTFKNVFFAQKRKLVLYTYWENIPNELKY